MKVFEDASQNNMKNSFDIWIQVFNSTKKPLKLAEHRHSQCCYKSINYQVYIGKNAMQCLDYGTYLIKKKYRNNNKT